MHPLLASRLRVALYVGAWIGIGFALAWLLVVMRPRPFGQALLLVGPPILIYASACLSAWWVCRSRPLASTPPVLLVGSLIGAALQASALLVALAAIQQALLRRFAGIGIDRAGALADLAFLFVAGTVLYLESLVVHYFLVVFE